MKHLVNTQAEYAKLAQFELNKGNTARCSDLINIIAYYGDEFAERVYLRIFSI